MRKFYYFSKNKLKFIEIENFNRKFIFLVLFFSIVSSFFVFGGYFILDEFLNPNTKISALKNQNRELNRLYSKLLEEYKNIGKEISELENKNKNLKKQATPAIYEFSAEVMKMDDINFADITPSDIKDFSMLIDNFDSFLARLNIKLDLVRINYQETERSFKSNDILYKSLPSVKPCSGNITEYFGMHKHPVLDVIIMHTGIKIATMPGTPVYATGSGIVEYLGLKAGYGKTIIIDHGNGFKTSYSHLSKYETRRRRKVERGDLIGYSGDSGKLSTGPHLYYEVRHNDIPLNPVNFIFEDLKLFEVDFRTQNSRSDS